MNEILKDKFESLTKAFLRLKEGIEKKTDDKLMKRDSCIQRFEFTIELFWKFLRKYMIEMGEEEAKFPKDILRKAYKYHLIDTEKVWLEMLNDRNRTSHIYDEDEIEEIYTSIVKKYYPEMKKTYKILKKAIENK